MALLRIMDASTDDSMRGKVCVITGGTSGIGRVAAVELAKKGARVLFTGRDVARGEAVLKEIQAAGGAAEFLPADLLEQAGVRQLAARIRERVDTLHVLVNNAGTVYVEPKLTADGIERTFATNHLAPFLLTNLLHDALAAAGGSARIVTVSSEAHQMGRIDLDDLGGERRYRPIAAYANSKLANILFTTELALRWGDQGIIANSLHPGVVRTNIWSNSKGILRWLTWIAQPFMLSPERGARTIIYLAASPEVAQVSGKYFVKCREVTPTLPADAPELAVRLWETSARLTGLA